ncbi:glycosyltransferase [Oscillatoria sp. FACHB-1406]|uniref:glycosyltransferase n=1 Tax=Oscillatoria sp. FACHB-1406 TaxID=2692846 RepID=UPI001685AD97|nr:glycosyltransferase [Oscillatoria sp. FACHB-1406]MBD2580258.1 glycosyltransferase [Oscillatoria sp. FACHB-1406]
MSNFSTPPLPKVSLVMTVYNTEAYLAEALESVLAQTFPDWELILWDDGSTDRSVAIAQNYAQKDARIRFQQGDRLGRGRALSQAHRLTQGEYVGWLDADDRLASTALQETVEFLDRHPEYGMVYTNHVNIDLRGQRQGLGQRCKIPYSPIGLLVDLLTFHFRLLRQSVFATIGGIRPEFTSAEDYDLSLRVAEVTQIYHLERPLYFYRINPQGISHQQQRLQRESSERAVNEALRRRGLERSLQLMVTEAGEFHLQQFAPWQAKPITDAARSHFKRGKSLAGQGDLAAAVACFQEAIRLQPDYIAAHNQLGNALQGLGQLEAAIAAYQHLLTFNPTLAQAYCNLGALWQIQGKTQNAIAAYQQAIQLKPDLAAARQNLANLRGDR